MTVGGDGLVSAVMKPHLTQNNVNRSDFTAVRRVVPLEALWGEKRIRPQGFFFCFNFPLNRDISGTGLRMVLLPLLARQCTEVYLSWYMVYQSAGSVIIRQSTPILLLLHSWNSSLLWWMCCQHKGSATPVVLPAERVKKVFFSLLPFCTTSFPPDEVMCFAHWSHIQKHWILMNNFARVWEYNVA